jgi:hypothetical protein
VHKLRTTSGKEITHAFLHLGILNAARLYGEVYALTVLIATLNSHFVASAHQPETVVLPFKYAIA